MRCPNGHDSRQTITLGDTSLDRCAECGGLWFEQDGLRRVKDSADDMLRWYDIDLWNNQENFSVKSNEKRCPKCDIPLFEILYGNSDIRIDACKTCEGVWLDTDELARIITFVRGKSADTILHSYLASLFEEGKEVFTGPESLKSEAQDFLLVLKLLQFKLVIGNPGLTAVLMSLPFTR